MGLLAEIRTDPTAVRVLRLAFGITLAVAVALGIGWPLSYITPILLIKLLARPAPCLSFEVGAKMILVMTVCLFGAAVLSSSLNPYPTVLLLLLGLAFLWAFYLGASGASQFLVLMLLLGLAVFPLLSLTSSMLAFAGALGLIKSAIAAILIGWISFAVIPDTRFTQFQSQQVEEAAPLSRGECFAVAVRSTLIVFPISAAFLMFNLTSDILVLVFIAILAQQPDANAGVKAGIALVLGNVAGGLIAIIVFNLLVVMPSFSFLLVLVFALSLLFGPRIFEDKPAAQLWSMALSTVILLIGATTGITGGEADATLWTRIIQISLASAYIVFANLVYASWRLRGGISASTPIRDPESA